MTVREMVEEREKEYLSPNAVLACRSSGRMKPEEESDLRTCFMRDRDRIIHSKSFRRLKHKTQVFLSPEGDHYRTRLTHTLEVSQIARTIARALQLNEDLTEAIALGHDLGHTAFGHAGERAINAVCSFEFSHNRQSLRVVDRLEKNGRGLNLTNEVRDGIVCHCDESAMTLEGRIVRFSDVIAYINHDIDDAIRAGILRNEDIPEDISKVIGTHHSQRINTLVYGVVDYGRATGAIGMEDNLKKSMDKLHEFLFEKVYRNPIAKAEEHKGEDVLKSLYHYFCEHVELLPEEIQLIGREDGDERAVVDYVAGMSDRYAISVYREIFIPKDWDRF